MWLLFGGGHRCVLLLKTDQRNFAASCAVAVSCSPANRSSQLTGLQQSQLLPEPLHRTLPRARPRAARCARHPIRWRAKRGHPARRRAAREDELAGGRAPPTTVSSSLDWLVAVLHLAGSLGQVWCGEEERAAASRGGRRAVACGTRPSAGVPFEPIRLVHTCCFTCSSTFRLQLPWERRRARRRCNGA